MLGLRFDVSVVIVALLASASFVSAQEEPAAADATEKNASPQLILKTDEAFVHFAPWAPPREASWNWSPDGELYLTQRDDGTMVRLLSSGVEALPTRRMKYVETRIVAVGLVKDQLVAVVGTRVSWDRPPSSAPTNGSAAAGDADSATLSRSSSIHLFSLADGARLSQRPMTEADTEKLKTLSQISSNGIPAALSSELAAELLAPSEEANAPAP